jgi:hypothetical protein
VRLIAESLPDAFAAGDNDVIAAFRELVERVIVTPSTAGQPVEMELRGRLSALIGQSVFPERSLSGGAGGSGGGTRTPNARIISCRTPSIEPFRKRGQ